MKLTGTERIQQERSEQVNKHNRTVEKDKAHNDKYQLAHAARALITLTTDTVPEGHIENYCPLEWDAKIWGKMCRKAYSERLIIAGALLAAEYDRISHAALDGLISPRYAVYRAIDSERHYQEKMKEDPDRPDMLENLQMGAVVAAIQHNLDLARAQMYSGSEPHETTMVYLRKIAGLCVQAGEERGMPERGMS